MQIEFRFWVQRLGAPHRKFMAISNDQIIIEQSGADINLSSRKVPDQVPQYRWLFPPQVLTDKRDTRACRSTPLNRSSIICCSNQTNFCNQLNLFSALVYYQNMMCIPKTLGAEHAKTNLECKIYSSGPFQDHVF